MIGLALAFGLAAGAATAGGGAGIGMAATIAAEDTIGPAFTAWSNCAGVTGARSSASRAGSGPAAGSRSMRTIPTGPARSNTSRDVPGVNAVRLIDDARAYTQMSDEGGHGGAHH